MALSLNTPIGRFSVGVLSGIAAGLAAGFPLGPAVGALVGWSVFALVLSGWILIMVWPMDPARTREFARREDPGRDLARILALVGSVVSLIAVAVVLIEGARAHGPAAWLMAAAAVVSVVASWTLIQVDYMLRYARIYYSDPGGGIDFNDEDPPQYSDFAYFSVGLGMTYQVADTNVKTKELRKVVIAQTMLAYLFGAVILATVINLVTGLG